MFILQITAQDRRNRAFQKFFLNRLEMTEESEGAIVIAPRLTSNKDEAKRFYYRTEAEQDGEQATSILAYTAGGETKFYYSVLEAE